MDAVVLGKVNAVKAQTDLISGLFDPSKYILTQTSSVVSLTAQNTWYDFINITGKGFLETGNVYSTGVVEIKITIDGVDKFYNKNTSSGCIGIFYNPTYNGTYITGFMANGTGGMTLSTIGSSLQVFPYTANSVANGNCVLSYPFYFNSSLRIQVRCTSGASQTGYCLFRGGLV